MFDPFPGGETTLKVSCQLKRKGIDVEIDKKY
ncbi:MAG: hypothetical protein ACPLRV_06965 [Candidatus Hydrothermia bacterium]